MAVVDVGQGALSKHVKAPSRVLVAAGSGAIGQGFLRELRRQFPKAYLVASYFEGSVPKGLADQVVCCDLGNPKDVQNLIGESGQFDWLINAAGLLHRAKSFPEKTIRRFDDEFFLDNIRANTLPSLNLARYAMPQLRNSDQGVFAAVSAKVGSIEDNQLGGWYSYRASKAALNMALKTLAIEWRRSLPNVLVASLHPGTTDTALSKPFQGNVPEHKLFSPDCSAGRMLDVLQSLSLEDSGGFWSWDGERLPW